MQAQVEVRPPTRRRRNAERGSEILEAAFVVPLLVFFLIGAFDLGFYMYAFIAVQNAVRVAALDTSFSAATTNNVSLACTDVTAELRSVPNYSSFSSGCNSTPLVVTAVTVPGPDGNTASLVTVTYSTVQLIPIPGLSGQLNITRSVVMRARS
jgi:Flp pilus assembly protein TadG